MSAFDPKRPSTNQGPEPALTTTSGVRVIVRDLPPPEAEPEPEPWAEPPSAIIIPDNQPQQDRDAFMAWAVETWGGYIERTLARRGDVLAESAKDLRQRVLLVLMSFYEKEKKAPDNMKAYIEDVIPKVVSNHKQLWRPPIEHGADVDAEPAEVGDPERAAETAEQKRKLGLYLAQLSMEEVEVFQAIEFQGMTFEQAAEALNRPLSTVYGQYTRAKQRLESLARTSEETAARARVRFRR